MLNDPRLFEQVDGDTGTGDHAAVSERHVQVFTETRRVVVHASTRVAERLHDRIHYENLVLQIPIGCLLYSIQIVTADSEPSIQSIEGRFCSHPSSDI